MSSQSCTQRRKTQQRENEVQSFQGSSTPEQKIGDSPLELSEELDQEEMAQEDIVVSGSPTDKMHPMVAFSRRDTILKTSTPVRPPTGVDRIAKLNQPSGDHWDRVNEDRKKTSKRNQIESPFLRLPPEVRNMIYTRVLGGRTYHFQDTIPLGRARLDTKGEGHILSILLVCHQIYAEASILPYSLNTFRFREFENSLNPFLDHRLYAQSQAITSIELLTYQADRMWAGPHEERDLINEIEATNAWERLPNLEEIRVFVDINESLYVQYGTREFYTNVVLEFQRVLEVEVEKVRPLLLVRFFWA